MAVPTSQERAWRRRWGAAAVAFAVIACAGIALAPGAPAGPAKAKRGHVLNPHIGERLPARTVLIRVRAGSEASPFRAQLNGEPVARHFSKPRRGVRRLKASLDHGLKHGRNRLHVRVAEDSEWTRFRIKRGRHLVGAGVKRRVSVGAQVFLSGRHVLAHSRHRRNAAAVLSALRAGSGASYRWKTVAGPQHHEAGGGETRDQPSRARTRTPTFRPTLPGRYRLRLTVTTTDGTSASATTSVQANPPPAVPVDTMVDLPTGIRVGIGDQGFYPAEDASWAQLVALDRSTLSPSDLPQTLQDLANKSYSCIETNTDACFNALKSDLARLTSKQIAIVSNPCDGPRPLPTTGGRTFEDALASIGVGRTDFSTQDGNANTWEHCSISAIGVPGTKPGKGDWHAVRGTSQGVDSAGEMRGYLVRNNEKNYDFAPTDRIDFDTQAEGSSGSANVIQVGDQKFTHVFDQGNGFQVVVLDAQTLEPQAPADGDPFYWFETDHSDKQALIGQLNAMAKVIRDANASQRRQIVLIASIGAPQIEYYRNNGVTAPDDQVNGAVVSVVDAVERLGGTRAGIYKMLDPALAGFYGDPGYSYTLVSLGGSGAANGDESVGPPVSSNAPLNATPMSGTLARTGPNYTFEVQTSQTSSPEGADAAPATGDLTQGAADLEHVVFQDPTPWPEQDPNVFRDAKERTRKQAAIKWIGGAVKDLGTDDPRAQYWTLPYTEGAWKDIASAIQALDYSKAQADGVSFTKDDLEWAKAELAGPLTNPAQAGGEILWLIRTHRYLDELAKPLADTSLQQWAAVTKLTNDVRTQSKVSADVKRVRAEERAWSDFARELIPELVPEKAATPAFVVNDIYELVTELVEINNEPAEDEFEADAGKVGTEFTERLAGTLTMLQRHIPNTIAADYGKLKAVGSCLLKDAACPFDSADWQLTQDFQDDAGKAILPATEIWAYGALLPARYTAWALQDWWRTSAELYNFGLDTQPFEGIPTSAQVAIPVYRNMPTYGYHLRRGNPWQILPNSELWRVRPFGYYDGPGVFRNPWTMHFPDQSVTDRLFKPAKQGGLAVDPEAFLDRSFKPKTLDHWPDQDSGTPAWCPHLGGACPPHDAG